MSEEKNDQDETIEFVYDPHDPEPEASLSRTADLLDRIKVEGGYMLDGKGRVIGRIEPGSTRPVPPLTYAPFEVGERVCGVGYASTPAETPARPAQPQDDSLGEALDLDALSELEQAATPGPWGTEISHRNPGHALLVDADEGMVFWEEGFGIVVARDADAEFIAALRNNATALIQRVRDAEAALTQVASIAKAAIDNHDSDEPCPAVDGMRRITDLVGGESRG